MYKVYILECSDWSFYTWITNDLEKRLKQHNWELKWWAKYTRWRRPIELVYLESIENKSLALKREIEIKKLTKKQKLNLINKNLKIMEKFKNREDYEKNKKYMTKNNCPFCLSNFKNTHKILFESKYWSVIEALYPYFDEKWHLLVIPKRHKEFTASLSKVELWGFKEVEKFMQEYFEWKDYFSFIRQAKWNKSVEHLHYHYLPWKPASRVIDWEKYFKVKK